MPEGDTVYRQAAGLRSALAGMTLTHTDFRIPSLATVDLRDWKVTSVRSRGKHLLIDVAAPDSPSTLCIHSHLKMEGTWDVYPARARWRRPAHQARVILHTATRQAVGFSLGLLELIDDPDQELAYLGPDLLGADWDSAEATRRLCSQPDTEIGIALLNQRLLAGIGNEYRNELCFLRGVLPTRRVGDTDVEPMVELAHRMLEANKMRLVRTTTGNTARNARLWVYGRGGQLCRRCATPINRGFLGEDGRDRVIYWCPSCQT